MSNPPTDPSGNDHKTASLGVAARTTLSGIRRAYGFLAGAKSTRAGLAGSVYNKGLRPLRAALAPNLGRPLNTVRGMALGYSVGGGVTHAHQEFGKGKNEMRSLVSALPEERKKEIMDRLSVSGAAKAVFRDKTGIGKSREGSFGAMADRIASTVASSSVGSAFAKHRDATYGGKTINSYLNPLGSRILSSGAAKSMEQGKDDVVNLAKEFASKYKDFSLASTGGGK